MISFIRRIGKREEEKNLENKILRRIEDKTVEFLDNVKRLKNLNILELKSDKEKLIEEQYNEMKELINSLNILSDIFIELKNYIEAFINEINENKYLSPSTKVLWLKGLSNNIKAVKEKVEKIFMEIEVLYAKLERL